MWSSQYSRQFIGSCDFLYERLADPVVPEPQESDQPEFELWRGVFDSGAERLFEWRLASLSLTEDQAKCAMGQNRAGSEIPGWHKLLEEAARYNPGTDGAPINFPFSPLWWPFVVYARDEAFRSPESRSLLSSGASEALANQLLQDICKLAAEPTYRIFAKESAGGSSFADFVRTTRTLRYGNIFESYPALARAVAMLVSNWVQTTTIFLSRLRSDLPEIGELLGSANVVLPVQSIKAGLSDRHEGGFQAALLEFSQGGRIVYKPKDVSLEAALPGVNNYLAIRCADSILSESDDQPEDFLWRLPMLN
jgi:hypothetical protein